MVSKKKMIAMPYHGATALLLARCMLLFGILHVTLGVCTNDSTCLNGGKCSFLSEDGGGLARTKPSYQAIPYHKATNNSQQGICLCSNAFAGPRCELACPWTCHNGPACHFVHGPNSNVTVVPICECPKGWGGVQCDESLDGVLDYHYFDDSKHDDHHDDDTIEFDPADRIPVRVIVAVSVMSGTLVMILALVVCLCQFSNWKAAQSRTKRSPEEATLDPSALDSFQIPSQPEWLDII